jgi:hypothetical protein
LACHFTVSSCLRVEKKENKNNQNNPNINFLRLQQFFLKPRLQQFAASFPGPCQHTCQPPCSTKRWFCSRSEPHHRPLPSLLFIILLPSSSIRLPPHLFVSWSPSASPACILRRLFVATLLGRDTCARTSVNEAIVVSITPRGHHEVIKNTMFLCRTLTMNKKCASSARDSKTGKSESSCASSSEVPRSRSASAGGKSTAEARSNPIGCELRRRSRLTNPITNPPRVGPAR